MGGTLTEFTMQNRSGSIRYGRSKFQTMNYWLPDWSPGLSPQPVLLIHRGGTLYNPGRDALQLSEDSKLEAIALMFSNDLGGVVIVADYRPGGFALPAGQDIERTFFPDVLEDFALPVMVAKSLAHDTTLWGGIPLSTDSADWGKAGSSSGAWGSGYTQLMPAGSFRFAASMASPDLYDPRFDHLCDSVICSIPQTVLSGFSKGSSGDGFYFSAFGEYSWAGAYFFDSGRVSNSAPLWGWDEFDPDFAIRRRADWDEWMVAGNPRVLDCGFYLTASTVSGARIKNITNTTDSDPQSMQNVYWRGQGAANTLGGIPSHINHGPAVDLVAVDSNGGGADLSKFVRSSGSWSADGYEVGKFIVASGFTNTINNANWVIDSVGTTDLIVVDVGDTMITEASGTGQLVRGLAYLDLHDPWNCYWAKYQLDQLGNTVSKMAAGNANTNPDATTLNISDNALMAADVKTWLTGTRGFADPV